MRVIFSGLKKPFWAMDVTPSGTRSSPVLLGTEKQNFFLLLSNTNPSRLEWLGLFPLKMISVRLNEQHPPDTRHTASGSSAPPRSPEAEGCTVEREALSFSVKELPGMTGLSGRHLLRIFPRTARAIGNKQIIITVKSILRCPGSQAAARCLFECFILRRESFMCYSIGTNSGNLRCRSEPVPKGAA